MLLTGLVRCGKRFWLAVILVSFPVFLAADDGSSHAWLVIPLLLAVVGCYFGGRERDNLARTNRSLADKNERLETILSNLPVISYTCEPSGNFAVTHMSGPVRELTGFHSEYFVKSPSFWSERLHPEDRKRVFAGLMQLPETGTCRHQYRWKIADGSWSWFEDVLRIVELESGKFSHVVGFREDATDRKRAHERLEMSEDRFRLLVEAMSEGVGIQDAGGKITYANKRLAEMLAYREGDLLGRELSSLMEGDSRQAFREEWRSEVAMIRKDGRPCHVLFAVQPLYEASGKYAGSFAVLTDISRLKQTERDLLAAKVAAEKANQSKSEFLANMSHEIRTPLNAILGFNQVLLGGEASPLEREECLEHIQVAGEHLTELLNNILDLSRIEAGKLGKGLESVHLEDLVRRLCRVQSQSAESKGVMLSFKLDPDLPEMLTTDHTKLMQILMNLLSNAIKFTPANKAVLLNVESEKGWVLFQVVDQGIGIPKEKQKLIFNVFEQADMSTTRKYGGTGLGLAISKKLTEFLGGSISVHSLPGEGTTFSVWLPVLDVQEKKRLDEDVSSVVFEQGNVVLVVEDNLVNQKMLQLLLERIGLKVYLAEDGRKGVEKAFELAERGEVPDLVLMDIHMPDMDGFTATRVLKASRSCRDIPVAILSADVLAEQQKRAFEEGVTDYLTKPVNMKKIMPVLRKYLRHTLQEG